MPHKHKYKFAGRPFVECLGWRCEICDEGQLRYIVPFYGSMLGLEARFVGELAEAPPFL